MPDSPDTPYRVGFVCLGNICRSPMAHVVFEHKLSDAGLADQFEVSSAGTGGWHTGEPMDPRAAAALAEAGYDPTRHIARHFSADWYDDHDLLLAMDHSNLHDMLDLAPTPEARTTVRLFRSYDPEATDGDDEVPDPWYGGPAGFQTVLHMIERTTNEIIRTLSVR